MKNSSRLLLLLSLLFAIIVLTACGTAPIDISVPSPDFLVSLPRVVIDIDANGVPSVLGFNTDQLYKFTGGQVDLRWMRMDPTLVAWFTNTNLQHVAMVQKEDGLYVFANGQALPHVAWDKESLQSVGNLIGGYYPHMQEFLIKFLPFLQRMGWNVVLHFPQADGVATIPMRDINKAITSTVVAQSQPSSIQLKLFVTYDENGVPAVPGAEPLLRNMLGIRLDQLRLTPQAVQALQASGIQHVTLRVHNNRLFIFVNDKVLPNLAWDAQGLRNGMALFEQLYSLQDTASLNQMLDIMIPMLENAEGELTLQFPLAPGVETIPLPASS